MSPADQRAALLAQKAATVERLSDSIRRANESAGVARARALAEGDLLCLRIDRLWEQIAETDTQEGARRG